ncbi:universal stress protein [Saccharopolyspora sp. TS4A08]|uniref:Universal stress protein n=1 Tax=Saccharopolyspora ipomoeae TaxID=3042027 RepID=A0ABT6PQH8_9PSEU|nr:universal stress protein [Saccharopolyspora sp. TS4A08]MDI2030250.1 universal stress protein [Saccharopolyspora sp. TS4A08]
MTDLTDTIVVGIDGSEQALNAVDWAAAEVSSRNLALRVVTSTEPYVRGFYGQQFPYLPDVFEQIDQLARVQLRDGLNRARAVDPDMPVHTEYLREPPISLLLRMSKTARLIALGASGRGGFSGMLLGSTATAVAAHASCPVAIVRDPNVPNGPVVVGVDGSETSTAALGSAFDEASRRKVRLVAVHVGETPSIRELGVGRAHQQPGDMERILAESLAGWRERYPEVDVERVAVDGQPPSVLLDWSDRAQLVVVGTRGRGGFRGMLLGSTSQALLHHARCPVLVIHGHRRTT